MSSVLFRDAISMSAPVEQKAQTSTVDQLVVSGCKASRNAGMCFWSSNGKGFVTDSCIKNCVSGLFGALLYTMSFGEKHGGSIKYCFFNGNKASNSTNGTDISFIGTWVGKISDSDVVGCYSTSSHPRVVDGINNKDNWLPDAVTSLNGFDQLFVSWLRGADEPGCGYRARPFKTIAHALIKRSTQNVVVFSGHYEENSISINSFKMEFIGHRCDNSVVRSRDVISGKSLISVENGDLIISAFTLIHDSATSASGSLLSVNGNGAARLDGCEIRSESDSQAQSFSRSLIEAKERSTTIINNCLFKHICMENIPLISMESVNDITFSGSVFDGIVRKSGNGSLVEVIVDEGEKLSLVDFRIRDCSCLDGNGGALMVKMNNGSEVAIGNKSSNDFGSGFEQCKAEKGANERGVGGGIMIDCTAGGKAFEFGNINFTVNKAVYGKNVFVVATELEELCSRSKFGFILDENVLDELMGFEESEIGAAIPFVLFWKSFPLIVTVSGSAGSDHLRCGFSVSPCRTLQYAVRTHFSSSIRKIKFVPPFKFDCPSVFDDWGYDISVERKGTVIEVVEDSSSPENGFVETRIDTDISNISFSLPSSLPQSKPFLCCTSHSLSLHNCCIVPSKSDVVVEYSFCCVLNGTMCLDQFEIVDTCFGSFSAICVSGENAEGTLDAAFLRNATSNSKEGLVAAEERGSISIQNSEFSSCTLDNCSVVFSKNGKNMNITNTDFHSITRQKQNGACLCISSDEDSATVPVNLSNCEFVNCGVESESNGGGAIYVCSEDQSSLAVEQCSFTSCHAPWAQQGVTKNGRGGALFLDLSGENPSFTIADPTFSDNKAEHGKNMFLKCNDLNSTVTNDKFSFLYGQMASDETLFDGSDTKFLNTDLFRFLIKYESGTVFVSEDGADVLRCGSNEDPCKSFWKGMKQIKSDSDEKKIMLKGECSIRDEFHISDLEIESSTITIDEPEMSTLMFENVSPDEKVLLNVNRKVTINHVRMSTSSDFVCLNDALIAGQNGNITIMSCQFYSLAPHTNPLSVAFVQILNGCLMIQDLEVESINIGRSMIDTSNKVNVGIIDMKIQSVNLTDGSLVDVVSIPTSERNEEKKQIQINSSSFLSVNGKNDESRVLSCIDSTNTNIFFVYSNFSGCQSPETRKGGCILIELCEGGLFNLKKCLVEMCGCSTTNGRGGGLYLRTELTTKLSMHIEPLKFDSNTAQVGRDMFVECINLNTQINETMFKMDFDPSVFVRLNAIYGIDRNEFSSEPVNLLDFILIFQSDTIVVSSEQTKGGKDTQQCGTLALPCTTIGYSLIHLTHKVDSRLLVDLQSVIDCEIELCDATLMSRKKTAASIEIKEITEIEKSCIVNCSGSVALKLISFHFPTEITTAHSSFFYSEHAALSIESCQFSGKANIDESHISFALVEIVSSELRFLDLLIENISVEYPYLIHIHSFWGDLSLDKLRVNAVQVEKNAVFVEGKEDGNICVAGESFDFLLSKFENISISGEQSTVIHVGKCASCVRCANISLTHKSVANKKGSALTMSSCQNISLDSCLFDGTMDVGDKRDELNAWQDQVCRWNGSMVEPKDSSVAVKDTIISNASNGGLSVCGGTVVIEMGLFANNNPRFSKYPSVRRNIICSDSGSLSITSLKGGDGWERNTSLWMLNDVCGFGGIVSERGSSFFIPVLEKGEEELIETFNFEESDFESENAVVGVIDTELLRKAGDRTEVSVKILFGRKASPSSTDSFILKNKSETEPKGDEKLVEGEREGKPSWALIIAVLFVVLFFIVLIVAIAFIVRWRKQKRRTEELEIIVEDTVKKDPKAFEMVTMEMSPEEQWKRAEREAEKKNEERIKKRVYEKSLSHSESSEHLLSESGSTEYILGRDSDKIPQWMLEKVDEKEDEETRKRAPSPSISSTSTTDTSDTESTFVRREDLCPTTSSMSNLVDAMACSSPHEKLIVDLRDSLFMLLHGRNEKKEMVIGNLQEREQTAAQVLFWVANLAQHSFDEMENPLQSLTNLSPHIVLFSEHMVICIVMHSDFSSDDDSDSSSISSSTVVTSASGDDEDSLPSSAFEDEDDFRKECLRWKAPELLINKKMGATKESVSFSIGMMLWECLSLQIPFGEYEAEVAGQKIVNGERPKLGIVEQSHLSLVVRSCWSDNFSERMSLTALKREFIHRIPEGCVMLTMSDAIALEESGEDEANGSAIESGDDGGTLFSR
ncbi:uncharacterized protein MONOS_14764 [Monocercomonoides exilis]|uniref:uncharacterized protein n=1 Tax=Monocercomonoides exilis TaxID=2049356 RepID=UPI00355A7A37|nr:hypothetical protein MONOS_14764 [Monocercomonoides exilis]|eukprot:MONOS_14764.1-p1 / transcript=MONOS_14764.1 / gene=MONOS_14764 / organism=Monocercomonoides_exilis_PA203 / gene_product=unspecified product / transcript_product=unspecified product / location=Mono_scaffold01066:5586-12510(+) / protein_length=2210 / sequence_SO=supercontig / SO=protein_coding / is_pseudo=false